jgi:hypothetical protein
LKYRSRDTVESAERLTPAQRLHRRFNEASTRVRGLKTLIAIRQASGEDFSALWRTLEHAESETKLVHAELAKVGRERILSRISK